MGFLANLIAKFKLVYILRHSIAVPTKIGFNSLRIALIYYYSFMASFIAIYLALSLASLFIKVGYIVLELSLVAENVKFGQSDSCPAAQPHQNVQNSKSACITTDIRNN